MRAAYLPPARAVEALGCVQGVTYLAKVSFLLQEVPTFPSAAGAWCEVDSKKKRLDHSGAPNPLSPHMKKTTPPRFLNSHPAAT